MQERFISFIGILVILGFCLLISRDRRNINWTLVAWGIGLQIILGILILKTYPATIFAGAEAMFNGIYAYADEGSKFLFGSLAEKKDLVILSMGAVIIFVSSMMAVLNFARILPAIIYGLAKIMQWTMRTSGAETLASAMFILMGIEATTGLKTVIGRMTRSELFSVMTCFMATIAGSVMAVYVGIFGANPGYILTASIMSAPAALALSKMIIPETETPETAGNVEWKVLLPQDRGFIEAAANGAIDGIKLAATIGAILLAFVSIIHMLDGILGLFGLSFKLVTGYLFAPVAFLLGVPWHECITAGHLLGVKTVFNEWIAYSQMQELAKAGELSARAQMILTYAMCSFANFGSLGILIGGISVLAPERREEVTQLGLWALLAGLFAGFLTAAIAGVMANPVS